MRVREMAIILQPLGYHQWVSLGEMDALHRLAPHKDSTPHHVVKSAFFVADKYLVIQRQRQYKVGSTRIEELCRYHKAASF